MTKEQLTLLLLKQIIKQAADKSDDDYMKLINITLAAIKNDTGTP